MVTNSRDEPIKPLRGNSSTSGILKTSLFSSHKSARHPAHYQVASGYLAKHPHIFSKATQGPLFFLFPPRYRRHYHHRSLVPPSHHLGEQPQH